MSIVFSHTTALEILRDPRYGASVAQARIPMPSPEDPPSDNELSRAVNRLGISPCKETRPHMACAHESGLRENRESVIHRQSCELPRGAYILIADGLGVASPEHLLIQMAPGATDVELMLLTCELCGLYAVCEDEEYGITQRPAPLTTKERILGYLNELGPHPHARRVRRAVAFVGENAGSPRESMLYLRFSLPRRLGGYAMQPLAMNLPIEMERLGSPVGDRTTRMPDLVLSLPEGDRPGICVEYAGSPHLQAGRPQLDDLRQNELMACGFEPYTIWSEQYNSMNYMDNLVDGTLRRKLGLARRRPGAEKLALERARRDLLLCELNSVDGRHWGISESSAEYESLLARVEVAKDAEWAKRNQTQGKA
ncbi:MAG: hypothetical protein Q4B45_05680 [Coriobacteriia bacterium]|nr:hypothetical protein [Coriobacteriia bacterium]